MKLRAWLAILALPLGCLLPKLPPAPAAVGGEPESAHDDASGEYGASALEYHDAGAGRNGDANESQYAEDTTAAERIDAYLRSRGTCRRSDAGVLAKHETHRRHPVSLQADAGSRNPLPPEVIQRIIRERYGAFRSCYEEALRRLPTLVCRVTVRFVITQEGTVVDVAEDPDATDGGSNQRDPEMIACVMKGYHDLCFPPPEGNRPINVVYPIMFTPSD